MSGPLSNPFMFKSSAAASSFYDYKIANSYRSMAGVGHFTRTPGSAGNRKTYTISFILTLKIKGGWKRKE